MQTGKVPRCNMGNRSVYKFWYTSFGPGLVQEHKNPYFAWHNVCLQRLLCLLGKFLIFPSFDVFELVSKIGLIIVIDISLFIPCD